MARVVFSLTTAQVKALLEISKTGERNYADYGSASALVSKGWAAEPPRKEGAAWSWRSKYKLTRRGRVVLALVRELKLDRVSEKTPAP